MQVNLSAGVVAKGNGRGQPVPDDVVAAGHEPGVSFRALRSRNHQIKVCMVAGLFTEQTVDAPTAIDPIVDVLTVERCQHIKYVPCFHLGQQRTEK